MDASKRRAVAGPGGSRYFAMLVDRDAQDRLPRRAGEPRRCAIFFEDQAGRYIGSAPLYHRIPLWSVTDQEMAAMLQEALQRR